ncbi:MAG TPA: hypothetical protein VFH95_06350 [Candidatus Kapabacteria bacterium]|nr:hypothetical protein [Candidatus Kapabacteria bacterium]
MIFCIAAILGLVMFLGFHLRNRSLPIPVMLIHGILAITAFIWLLA